MAKQPELNSLIESVFPADLLPLGKKVEFVELLNGMPLTHIQRVDLMMQWLARHKLKITAEDTAKLN